MFYVDSNPYKLTEDSSYAERIRSKRMVVQYTEEDIKQTRDIFERSGCKELRYPAYTKLAVIDWPARDDRAEMREVMEGYYEGKVSAEDIKEFFTEYCSGLSARGEKAILNVYETFLDVGYAAAVSACFEEGERIANKEGRDSHFMVYYDAEYYYKSEEIHTALQEAAKEYGAKYGVEVDAVKRDENFQKTYPTGTPNFHDKWNYMAQCMYYAGGIVNKDAVPPRDFSFFFKRGGDNGEKDNLLIISGKGWSESINMAFALREAGKSAIDYFYLSDLLRVNSGKEENHKWYNNFLNKLYINRTSPGLVIKRR
ncbi:MAG: hypothetical protein HDR18_12090 [Lachnospiraceae bacterium]|nr:hypothetical protein [Lachnospiraceae bacterium]